MVKMAGSAENQEVELREENKSGLDFRVEKRYSYDINEKGNLRGRVTFLKVSWNI